MKTAAIVNPAAGRGRAARQWPRIGRALARYFGSFTTHLTAAPGDAERIARTLVEEGVRRIFCVGGDGTLNEIANGAGPQAILGLIAAGTGRDFARALGLAGDPVKAVAALAGGESMAIDAARARFTEANGALRERWFLNVASFGLGGEVTRRRSETRLGYLAGTLAAAARFRAPEVALTIDGARASFRILHVAIGNGAYQGGGMCVCPGARLDDGILEVTVIEEMPLLRLLGDIRVLYTGRIYQHPKVKHWSAARLRAESAEAAAVELDGEPAGFLPVEIEVAPRAFRVLAPRRQ